MLFWHVTCDISTLKCPERYLVNRFKTDEEPLEHLGLKFDGLEQLHNTFNFDVGILETPPMFWCTWNKQHGDPDWQTRDYMIFHNQVTAMNSRIQEIHNRLDNRSPMFVCDSMIFRKLRKMLITNKP